MAEASLKLGGSWATKEGSLLGFNDENGNYKPIPFDFTRATTATRVNRDGLIEEVQSGVPRIDFLDNADGSLLPEPQRTNLITYSEDFSQSYWTKSGSSIVSNNAISPDGTLNASKLVENTSNTEHICFNQQTGVSKTFSFFAKSAGNQYVAISYDGGNNFNFFDIENGILGNLADANRTSKIEDYGNGWYRCSMYNGHSTYGATIWMSKDGVNTTYTGNGTSGVYIWGAQLEAGSYPTSYIPTSGSAVTRNADVCQNISASDYIGQTEGTIFAEIDYTPHSINYELIASLQGTSSQQYIEFYFTSNNTLGFGIYNGGAVQMSFTSAVQTKGIKKIAIAYKSNDFAIYLNGTQLHTDNSGSVPLLSSLGLGNNIALSNYQLSQPIKQFQLYKTRLSNTELAELTTI